MAPLPASTLSRPVLVTVLLVAFLLPSRSGSKNQAAALQSGAQTVQDGVLRISHGSLQGLKEADPLADPAAAPSASSATLEGTKAEEEQARAEALTAQDAELEKLRKQVKELTAVRDAELAKLRKQVQELSAALVVAKSAQPGDPGEGGHYGEHAMPGLCDRKSRCTATEDEMRQYLDYTPQEACPDDWYFVQHLIFVKNCFCLPRRRCFTATPPSYKENEIPFPDSLFDQRVLDNHNVRWNQMYWPSFDAINNRTVGDCRDCFNLTLESYRWKHPFRGTIPMEQVLALKPKGSLKIGLDAGGGTGSFAAHMAQHGITIVTTAMDTETIDGFKKGLPYMETIALRGLIPLHIPHVVRQPFFDGTLDVIHSVNSIKYLSLPDFEALLFEWDRILRPGGILWFEMFYAPRSDMRKYLALLRLFNYKRLYWNMTPKEDGGERPGPHVYLNCVLEKPVIQGPRRARG